MSRKRIRLAALVCTVAMIAAVPASAEAKKIITISGSTSVFPLETKLARAWIKTKKGKKFAFKISQGGSNVGVSDVSKGRVSIGASSRDPATGDPGGLVFTKISRDALCVITNNANQLPNITKARVRSIFVNGPGDWGAIPGATVGGTITAIGRAPTSGTHDAFRSLFLDGTNQASYVAGKASNGLVQQGVIGDPQAIGYASLAFQQGVHVVSYEGVECSLRNAIAGTYGGTRNFWFVTQGAPTGGVKKFIGWILKSKRADTIIRSEWVPLR
ncbi:MAG: substrate-binding domain-containing protein [Solirubrobacterales bacterium]